MKKNHFKTKKKTVLKNRFLIKKTRMFLPNESIYTN